MEKFLALPEHKQVKIRNAALSCFAKFGYEKASIRDIAIEAGISKASLFQYFGTKQALYEYLFHYCKDNTTQAYDHKLLDSNTDFFERVWAASVMKVDNLKQNPYISQFIAAARMDKSPEVQAFLTPQFETATQDTELMILKEQDRAKFKCAADPELVLRMLILMGEGMVVHYSQNKEMDYGEMMEQFRKILDMLKNNFYQEEYLK